MRPGRSYDLAGGNPTQEVQPSTLITSLGAKLVTVSLSVDSKALGLVLSHEIIWNTRKPTLLYKRKAILGNAKEWGVLPSFYGVRDLIMMYNGYKMTGESLRFLHLMIGRSY